MYRSHPGSSKAVSVWKKAGRIRWSSVLGTNAIVASRCSDHAIFCKGALSHILCVNCHVPRPVEQKATETHEWPGKKVKCIRDRLSPHSCCSPQLLHKHSPLNNQQLWTTVTITSLSSSSVLLCSARLYFSQFYPSPSFSPLSPSLFRSLSFLLSQCNVIQDWCWQPRLWRCNLCSGC